METKYDVLIVGAGPAGLAAAFAAAENGAKALLLERSGFAGGMSTDGQLNVFCGSASSGLFAEISRLMAERRGNRQVYDTEELKAFYLEKLTVSGVGCLFHTMLTDVHTEDGRILSLCCASASGQKLSLSADTYVDATGDGTLAALCGVGYSVGRESDRKTEPISLMTRLGGVDDSLAVYPTFRTHPALEQLARDAVEAGEILPPAGHVILIPDKRPGMACMNMTNAIGLDGTDPAARTKAEFLCRSQLPGLLSFLRRCVPGYKDAYVLSTAVYAGVRESRHFDGEYRLTEEDIRENTVFPDWCVSRARYSFGAHNPDGSGAAADNRPVSGAYTIPYRCLLPRGPRNLLLAGRCISGTHTAHSCYRVMPICMAIGQAAGTAAALAKAGDVRGVDTSRLQQTLLQQGVEPPTSVE